MILENSLILLLCASLAMTASVSVNDICAVEGSDNLLIPAEICSQYYICSQGAALTQNCQANLVFNPEGFCDWPENVNCQDKIIPVDPEETPAIPVDAEAAAYCAEETSNGALVPAQDCTHFYKCSEGQAVGFKCHAGLVYNTAGWCDWPENVDCNDRSIPDEVEGNSNETPATTVEPEVPATTEVTETPVDAEAATLCAEESSNNLLIPAKDCSQFYKCSEGQAVVFTCQAGLVYNTAGWCDWPENVDCNDRSNPDAEEEDKSEEATEKPDESPATSAETETPVDAEASSVCADENSNNLLIPAKECTQFYKCSEGQAIAFTCQAGLVYNTAGWCDWPENVDCNDRSIPDTEDAAKPEETPATSEEAESSGNGETSAACSDDNSDGALLSHEDCSKFYKCSEGVPVVMDCQYGLLFNPSGWCDWPQNVDCGSRANNQ